MVPKSSIGNPRRTGPGPRGGAFLLSAWPNNVPVSTPPCTARRVQPGELLNWNRHTITPKKRQGFDAKKVLRMSPKLRSERILATQVVDSQRMMATVVGAYSPTPNTCFCPGNLALAGQLYTASSGNLTAASGEVVQLVLVNPAGSTQTLQLVGTDFAMGTAYYWEAGTYSFVNNPPTTGLTPVAPSNTHLASPSPSIAQAYAGVAAGLPSGTVWRSAMVFSYLPYREDLEGSWVVPPGSALGLILQVPDDGTGGSVTVTVTWAEISRALHTGEGLPGGG